MACKNVLRGKLPTQKRNKTVKTTNARYHFALIVRRDRRRDRQTDTPTNGWTEGGTNRKVQRIDIGAQMHRYIRKMLNVAILFCRKLILNHLNKYGVFNTNLTVFSLP